MKKKPPLSEEEKKARRNLSSRQYKARKKAREQAAAQLARGEAAVAATANTRASGLQNPNKEPNIKVPRNPKAASSNTDTKPNTKAALSLIHCGKNMYPPASKQISQRQK